MDRRAFVSEFVRNERFVAQQRDRANVARGELAMYDAHIEARGGATPFLANKRADADAALKDFEIRLDAAITEFADFLWDAIEGANDLYPVPAPVSPAHSPKPLVSTSADENEIPRVGEREPTVEKNETNPSDRATSR